MRRPRASVIIPNWNGASLLPPCLDSLERQECRDFETVLVDNASRDGSLELVRQRYTKVRLVPLPRNLGFPGAVNAGIRATEAEFVVLLNNDTEADRAWLGSLLDAFVAEPEAAMAASRIMLYDRRHVFHSAGDLYGRDGIPRNRGVWEEDRGQYAGRQAVFGPCGGAAAYRRGLLEEIGLFDERFFHGLEDVDLAWRARLRGHACVYAPAATVYHRLSASGGGVISSYYTGRNTIAVIAKDVPGPLLRRHAPAMLRAQLGVALAALRAWRGDAARARLRGQLAGIPFAGTLLPDRRRIQSTRQASIADLESLLA